MSNEILVPSLGESISEATVAKWLKQVGEKIGSDEPIVELETDKVNIEVPSPVSGVLSSIKAKEGDTVGVGNLLGVVNKSQLEKAQTAKADLKEKKIDLTSPRWRAHGPRRNLISVLQNAGVSRFPTANLHAHFAPA